jgi:hypothetical protein
MPRIRRDREASQRPNSGKLVERLADELRNNRESGQPVILEQTFSTGKVRTIVIWDEWDRVALPERTPIILQAYQKAGVLEANEEIALASGLTVPEALAAGMLPFEIIAGMRKGDKVSLAECRDALIHEGATTLINPDKPRLRLATEEAAEAARKRLIQRLPGSDEIWIVTQDVTQEPGFRELVEAREV